MAPLLAVGLAPIAQGRAAHRRAKRSNIRSAPACVPAILNSSALLPGTAVAVSPLPGSASAPSATQISFVGAPASALSALAVSGSVTGAHPGRLRSYSQGDGASFIPRRPFAAGETVTVRGQVQTGGTAHPVSYSFVVATPDVLAHPPPGAQPAGGPRDVQAFHSRPDLHPPAIQVLTRSAGAAPGDLFVSPYSGPGQDGPLIFDDSGQVVWSDPLSGGAEATNLQVQQYHGQPVLTWWQGYILPQGFGAGEEVIADRSYRQIAHVKAGNGLMADLHDFQITPKGTGLLTVFDPISCDLASVGGPRAGAVSDGIVQELDLATGLVRREWHALDHVSLASSYQSARTTSTRWPFDFFHVNSIAAAPDGSLLVSARNTWALYWLDPQGEQVVNQVGGRKPTVAMEPGTTTAWQHDTRVLPDGTISVFDNGATPAVEPQSRGIVERLDPVAHTVTLVHQYTHPTPLSAGSQGNVQTLPNGDVFLGWGSQPYLTEFATDGTVLFDARLSHGNQSYRGFRFPWTGAPRTPPAVAAVRTGRGLTVYASWNGATAVTAWRVRVGSSPAHLATVATAPRSGFETAVPVRRPGPYAEVQALGPSGAVLGTSRVTRG